MTTESRIGYTNLREKTTSRSRLSTRTNVRNVTTMPAFIDFKALALSDQRSPSSGTGFLFSRHRKVIIKHETFAGSQLSFDKVLVRTQRVNDFLFQRGIVGARNGDRECRGKTGLG